MKSLDPHSVDHVDQGQVGSEWLEDFRRLFADEFPEPECPAAKAVEGIGHQRVQSNRFSEGQA